MKLQLDPLPAFKAKAHERLRARYNEAARAAHHADMVAIVHLARGEINEHPVEAREKERASLAKQIDAAKTLQDIEQVVGALA